MGFSLVDFECSFGLFIVAGSSSFFLLTSGSPSVYLLLRFLYSFTVSELTAGLSINNRYTEINIGVFIIHKK